MLLVVLHHFYLFVLPPHSSQFSDFCLHFRMPMFFFISGFLAYSPKLDNQLLGKRLKSRFSRQLWPTLVVLAIFILFKYALDSNVTLAGLWHKTLYSDSKAGYWFTYALVQIFLIFAAVHYLCRKYRLSDTKMTAIYAALIVVFAAISVLRAALVDRMDPEGIVPKLSALLSHIYVFHNTTFFLFGVIVKINKDRILTWLDSYKHFLLLLAITTALFGAESAYFKVFVTRYFMLATILSGAVVMKGALSSATLVGAHLIKIGQNTLPVYLFHYFFIHALTKVPGLSELIVFSDENPLLSKTVGFAAALFGSWLIMVLTVKIYDWIKKSDRVHRLIFQPI